MASISRRAPAVKAAKPHRGLGLDSGGAELPAEDGIIRRFAVRLSHRSNRTVTLYDADTGCSYEKVCFPRK